MADAKWELGAGIGHLSTNAYIGSSETVLVTTPVPFIKLKTDFFDLSEGAIKMLWFENTPFRLSFNFDLGLPVESNKVLVRQGMDDLDAVLQVGPMVSYLLSTGQPLNWKFELPLTAALSLGEAGLDSVGWVFTPRIVMRLQLNNDASPLDLEVSLGPVYGAKDYHQYYYSVSQNDSTLARNEYNANGGYAGYRLNVSFTKRVNDIWFGLYMRYHNLSDAEFSDSPLVDQKDYWLVTFAASWIIGSNY